MRLIWSLFSDQSSLV